VSDPSQAIDRRRFVKLAGLASAGIGLGAAGIGLGGCGSGGRGASLQPRVRLGYVTPQTGSLAGFGEADSFVVDQMREHFKDGVKLGRTSYGVDILVKDSQSDAQRAGIVAGDLMERGVDLMLVSSTPETTNPVSDLCEQRGVPCLSTVTAWQPWFFGRGGDPTEPFKWTAHFFWGLEDAIRVFESMWDQVPNNRKIASLFPDDDDGQSWGRQLPNVLGPHGFSFVDPGRYQSLSDDFSAQIAEFRESGAELLSGVPQPPDFATFWHQAALGGFRPKVVTVSKALLFPAFVEAIGPTANGLSTEVWWSPSHPFHSSLTGQRAGQLADEYTKRTGRQWTQPIGFVHALFEVAMDVLERAGTTDRLAIAQALRTTTLRTIVGPLDWNSGPVHGVAKTPLVGGQWRSGGRYPFELVVVANSEHPEIAASARLVPIAGST
jgi:branched-chain amino acid transport system substrate-binding protein